MRWSQTRIPTMTETPEGAEIRSHGLMLRAVLFVLAVGAALLCPARGDDWPQWRGPNRDNVSNETGLLREWPAAGPPRLWTAVGLGDGIASVSVAQGRIFTLGYQHGGEYALALDANTGELRWAARLGPAVPENKLMRWFSQRVPAVDEDRLYAFTSGGDLICLETADGKERWRKNYVADFGARRPVFGSYEQPLLDGDRLVCTPGGTRAQLVFLDKRTGDVRVWAGGPSALGWRRDYAATVAVDIGGARQYVTFLDQQLTGIAADDGRLLWRYERVFETAANSHTPIVRGDEVFCSAGYGQSAALLKVVRDGSGFAVREQYQQKITLRYFQDSTVCVDDHLYAAVSGAGLRCLAWRTGETLWSRAAGGGIVGFTYADGHLYVRGSGGQMTLIEATPQGIAVKGRLVIPDHDTASGRSMPVVAGGRLYLRDNNRLHCYDVRGGTPAPNGEGAQLVTVAVPPPERPPNAGGRPPNGVFVPTPHDVVKKMLDVARVAKSDVVCDLGCGDGRIVIAAAKRFGCRAIGYELDQELIALARQHAAAAGMEKLVAIEQGDVLGADLSQVDVVTLYLLPEQNEKLFARLQKMKPGARVVSHQFPLPFVAPDTVVAMESEESGESHTIYLYQRPFRRK